MVPVLSVHNTEAAPSDSIAPGMRVRTLFLVSRQAPIAINTDKTTGNSSGSIAIEEESPIKIDSINLFDFT